ncbi:MAG: LPS export ABC transporter permease LptG [Deltaproteobacteria bacterium]|nr:LPS export ABC transporter permease LptG [Deltaproteobacteria bacterium]
MPIIYKYILKEIIKFSGIVLGVVTGIYLAIDFFEKIDNFLEAKVTISKAFLFFILKIPFIIAQVLPVAVLLAVLIVFCIMIKNNEMIALKSGGVSIFYILKPVLLLGLFFTLFLFIISEVVVPVTAERSNRIWLKDVKKKNTLISKEKNIWIKGASSITHIKYYDPAVKTAFGITIHNFDKNFRLIKRIDSKKGLFKEGKWFFYDVLEQNLTEKDEKRWIRFNAEKEGILNIMPEDLKKVIKKSEEMSFFELFAYINKIEKEGYDAGKYRVDLYAKIAFPFVCFIMCLIGSGIAFKGEAKEAMPVKIAIGIGTAFLYWVFYSFCVSLGYGRMLPPVIAVCTTNIIFLCLGFYLLLNAE